MRQKKAKGFLNYYLRSILPPYTSKDLFPIITTIAIIFVIYIGLKPVLANAIDAEPPTQSKILIGNESPLVIPFTHSEQKSVHLFWTQSTDNFGVTGYRIYKNDTKIGETTQSHYDDYNTSGEAFYAVVAFDAEGNIASKSATTRIFLPEDWCNCADADDSVIAGFITDSLGKQLSAPLAFTISSRKINIRKTTYTSNSNTNGQYVNVFKNVTVEGEYDVSLVSSGFATQTKKVYLRPGLSTHMDWQLIYQPTKGRR